ncbi:MAG: hypothetical protein ACRDQA_11425 [Nocardioidaceae bacterium]
MSSEEYRRQRIASLSELSEANRNALVIRAIAAGLESHRRGRDLEQVHTEIYQLLADWQDANSAARLLAEAAEQVEEMVGDAA